MRVIRGETPSGIEYTLDTIGRLYGISEETDCAWCGMPLEVGDRALMLETGDSYCSEDCMEHHHPNEETPLDDCF